MYKVKDDNPQAGDWFWAKDGPDGNIQAEGKVEKCMGCHEKGKKDDNSMKGPLK